MTIELIQHMTVEESVYQYESKGIFSMLIIKVSKVLACSPNGVDFEFLRRRNSSHTAWQPISMLPDTHKHPT